MQASQLCTTSLVDVETDGVIMVCMRLGVMVWEGVWVGYGEVGLCREGSYVNFTTLGCWGSLVYFCSICAFGNTTG